MTSKDFIKKIVRSREGKNASWIIAGRIIQMILSFVISIFTARYLGPSNYGLINYATAFVAFFTAFCTLGINSVIIKNFSDNPTEEGETIGTTLVLRFVSSVISWISITLLVYIIDAKDGYTVGVSFLCSAALVFQVFDTIDYWFQSKYESKKVAIATLIAYIATSIYKIVLLVLEKNVLWFAFATSVDYICYGLIIIYFYKINNGPHLSISINKAKELLSKSYHYILSGMMVAIYGQTDKFMLKQMLSEEIVGYYSLAASINSVWVFVLSAIIDSMYPTIIKAYSIDREEFEKRNRQLYAGVIYISIIVAIGIVTFGKVAIKLLYGEIYLPSYEPLKIVCWYTIFSYLGVARNAWLVCENKQKYLKYIYAMACMINIILNYVLIPHFGASGAATASLITQVFTSICLPLCIRELRPNVKLMCEALLLRKL